MIRMLGRYELLEQVGSGGMAVVYRGRDTALDREVAVKLLHPHLASAPESRARFSREARAVARIAHPGIVEIYDYSGDAAFESYLVTEFVRGPTLRGFAQEIGFGYPEVAMLVGRALADALVHAHSAGVIHRDLKPENVLVKQDEPPAVKLADFGIARIIASEERMTMTGALVGSPHHMAPEIVEGKDADVRSDVFSLGTILYWLSTGKLPFAASNPTAILRRVLEGDVQDPRLADPRVADPLAELVLRCLAVDPAMRPRGAVEVRDALDKVLAQVGIDRPEDALIAFLRDPAAFRAAFPARAVATLTALGDGALVEGASARALGFFNRVLALEPSNDVVLRKLARLTRRRRTRRVVAVAAGAAVLGGALAVALAFREPPRPPSPSAPLRPSRPSSRRRPLAPRPSRRRRRRPAPPHMGSRAPPNRSAPRKRRAGRRCSRSTCGHTRSGRSSTASRSRATSRSFASPSDRGGATSSGSSTSAVRRSCARSPPRRRPPRASCGFRSSPGRPGSASTAIPPRGCSSRDARQGRPGTPSARRFRSRCRPAARARTRARPVSGSSWRARRRVT